MPPTNTLPRFANRGLIEAGMGSGSRSLGSYFPDSRIGASLKPEVSVIAVLQPEANFPDSRIGASLKPWCSRQASLAVASLPRFANRGLIEARSRCPEARRSRSLPRFANRGLIEATMRSAARSAATPDFPDSRIGASLKRVAPQEAGQRSANFPDSRIGASLKREATTALASYAL